MSENLAPRDLMERLARVDSKLEQLLAHQTLPKDEGLAETQPSHSPDEKFSADILVDDSEDKKIHPAAGFSDRSKNPLPSRVAISAKEVDSIFQKVEKINQDAEVMERVERLERQNRKIVILGSIFMTVSLLALSVFGYLMVQGNFLNKEAFLHAGQRVDPPHSSSGEATAKVNGPQLPAPIAAAHDPLPAEPVLKVSDPQPVATPTVPNPAEAATPVKYVGSMTSNKYHYPDCKWAKQILPRKLLHFPSSAEARKQGYIPCPTCHPPESD